MDFYIGTILPWAPNFAPSGWALCQGQSMSVSQNQALYSLIGNMYGGNTTNFNLPNLCGRFPIGQGTNPVNGVTTVIGSVSDTRQASLTSNNVPQHIHPITSSATVTGGGSSVPVSLDMKIPINTDATPTNVTNVPSSNATLCVGKAGAMTATIYTTNPPTANANLKSFQAQTNITVPSPTVAVTSNCGANVAPVPAAPFSTISPYLCVNYIIAIQGIYPTRD